MSTESERRSRKFVALTHYASDSCPACFWPKVQYRWLCVKCHEATKNLPEMAALDAACTAHLSAAKAVIKRAGDLNRERVTAAQARSGLLPS